jgi:dienelactone hydrolase
MTRFALVVIAVLALISFSRAAEVQKKDLDIKAPDGANLKGTYFSPGKKGPAILLLHQCNMNRHAWDGLGNDLASAGFHVLTFDFRGFGDSDGKRTNQAERETLMEHTWPGDVDAAFNYLLSQQGVDKSHLAVGGASCGVSQSGDLAARRRDIKVVIELSGMSTDATKAYVAQTPSLAIFGAASEGDTNPAKGIKDLLAVSKNPRSQLHIYPGTAHGVAMFAPNTELEPLIVSWLKTQEMGTGSTK